MDIWIDEPNEAAINQPACRGSSDVLCIYRNGGRYHFDTRTNGPTPVVLCIRDPKDVLISQYWSWKGTHVHNTQRINDVRVRLSDMSVQEGLTLLVEDKLVSFCNHVREWPRAADDTNIHLLRYESLLADFEPAFSTAAQHIGIEIDASYVADLKEKYSFQTIAKRRPGEEQRASHYRKGVQGDWINYFDDALAAAFDSAYGDVCDMLDYQRAKTQLRSD